ncbi:Genetic Element Protein A [Zobellia galactanivorans]|uniref:Genetic Element Protein A n=2 Tax=Zobellia galactanivorans (strain DSM 12802 / CCUG 47099 / CIP 106680 / NCIMB 13871 / Dsij) TaxID=63186 RepID=G0L483_ZOBGA|nr:Genetic Element Protein A [Zobellia galactanivorans]
MYNPITIANYFIYKSIDEGVPITPMKVLKLVYIAHGWHLGLKDRPLLTEQTEAWKYGPVVESVYRAFKDFGKNDIDKIRFFSIRDKKEFVELTSNNNDVQFLEKIWNTYKSYSGIQLSSLTHLPNTPWDVTWNKNGGSLMNGAIIPNSLIKEYYTKKSIENKN